LSNQPSQPTRTPEEDKQASDCKVSFSQFVKTFWELVPGAGKVTWNWHLDVICDELQEVAQRVFNNESRTHDLILNVPFGTSKSTLTSILFPAWVWANMPSARFICASHTDKLVNDLSSKCRSVITSERYTTLFPNITLVKDTESYFRNSQGGDRNTCTVGGKTPTGFHAHFILIDDPIDPQGARSEVELETASKFMTEVIPSRVVDKLVSVTILIMQRLHHRDPTKVMLDVAAKADTVPARRVCLPGELTDDVQPAELRDRYIDGLMDVRRLPRPVLKEYRARLGEYGYAGQVLQNPSPPGGGMFKRPYFNKRVKAAPWNCERILAVDRASTQDGGCYSALVLMAKDHEGNFYVEHCVHGQWEPQERNRQIKAEALRCRSRYGPNHQPVIYIEAERGSTGLESFQNIVRMLAGFIVKEDQPTGSKDVRAEPWSTACSAGIVSVVEDGTWNVEGYIEEHCLFRPDAAVKRLGKWKDQVDASSMAFNLLANTKTIPPMRTFHLGVGNKPKHLMIVVCKTSDLPLATIELSSLLVTIQDPERQGEQCERILNGARAVNGQIGGTSEKFTGVEGDGGDTIASGGAYRTNYAAGSEVGGECRKTDEIPLHAMSKMVDNLTLRFADIEPEAIQEEWETILPEFNAKPSEVIITLDHGKKLWAFLLKKRPTPIECIVFTSPNGRRALSIAKVVAEKLRLPEPSTMNADVEPTPNKHITKMVKSTRSMVVT